MCLERCLIMQMNKYCILSLTIFMQATKQSENDKVNDEKSLSLRSSHFFLVLAFIKTTHPWTEWMVSTGIYRFRGRHSYQKTLGQRKSICQKATVLMLLKMNFKLQTSSSVVPARINTKTMPNLFETTSPHCHQLWAVLLRPGQIGQ